jgi:hypothetical protein
MCMALDIGIGDGFSVGLLANEPSLFLEDDGYYWYLHPLFEELRAATGQYIYLYGDASFSGPMLTALEEIVSRAQDLVDRQPATWNVCVGQELVPWEKGARKHSKPRFAVVAKDQFLALLNRWQDLIIRAKKSQRSVVCIGD